MVPGLAMPTQISIKEDNGDRGQNWVNTPGAITAPDSVKLVEHPGTQTPRQTPIQTPPVANLKQRAPACDVAANRRDSQRSTTAHWVPEVLGAF